MNLNTPAGLTCFRFAAAHDFHCAAAASDLLARLEAARTVPARLVETLLQDDRSAMEAETRRAEARSRVEG